MKPYVQNLLLLFGSLVLFMLAFEAVLQLMGYAEPAVLSMPGLAYYTGYREMLGENLPIYKVYSGTRDVDHGWGPVRYTMNNQGFREDYDYNETKDENTYRVIVLGDSITWGWYVPMEATFSKVLEKKLQVAGYKAEVLAMAMPGQGTYDEYFHLKEEAINYKPDLIVIGYNLNDPYIQEQEQSNNCKINLLHIPINCKLKSRLRETKSLFFIRRGLQKMIYGGYQSEKQWDYWTGLINDKRSFKILNQSFYGISQISKENNVPAIVVVFPLLFDLDNYQWAETHSIIVNLTSSMGFYALDMVEPYRAYNNLPALKPGGQYYTHPSEKGHEIAADTIYSLMMDKKLIPGKYKKQ